MRYYCWQLFSVFIWVSYHWKRETTVRWKLKVTLNHLSTSDFTQRCDFNFILVFFKMGHSIERRSVTSRYHGNQISGSQQSFLTETAIDIVERWKKSLGYRFAPDYSHAKDSHACQCFRFFFCHICRTTVCSNPDILLPWERDETTSTLYYSTTEASFNRQKT